MSKKRFVILITGLVLATFVGVLYSCFSGRPLADGGTLFKKVEISSASQKVKTFVSTFAGKNGVYTYEDGTKVRYLLINGFNVQQGEKASYFSDVKVEVIDKTLIIRYNENFTEAYKNKELDNLLLYQVIQPEKVDTIRVFKNGTETHFDSCYVEK